MPAPRIYLSPPHLGDDELELVKEAFASNWIAPLGPHVDKFEAEFVDMLGGQKTDDGGQLCAAALSSGTAALHLALKLAGVKRGDEVVCSSFTFSASANPIVYEGAKPVFIDSETASWNMDPRLLAEALEDRGRTTDGRMPKAVILVHLYGQSADIDAIAGLCEKHGVPLIEDAAEALGARYSGNVAKRVSASDEGLTAFATGSSPGTVGKFGIFSFNGNKIITTSGGGMLVSRDKEAIEKARFLATQARDKAPHYQHSEIGYNYRLSNILAAIGRGQLRVLKDRVEARRRIFDSYMKALGGLPGVGYMPEAKFGRSTRWLTCITIDPKKAGTDREKVRLALEAENIEARPLWKPMHLQPVFAGCQVYGGEVSAGLFERGLCLPSGSAMTESDLERVTSVVKRCFKIE